MPETLIRGADRRREVMAQSVGIGVGFVSCVARQTGLSELRAAKDAATSLGHGLVGPTPAPEHGRRPLCDSLTRPTTSASGARFWGVSFDLTGRKSCGHAPTLDEAKATWKNRAR